MPAQVTFLRLAVALLALAASLRLAEVAFAAEPLTRPAGPGPDASLIEPVRQAVSADGQAVVFVSAVPQVADDDNIVADVFVRDRAARITERVSVSSLGGKANRGSFAPAISANGRFVAFASTADNLVPGDANGTF